MVTITEEIKAAGLTICLRGLPNVSIILGREKTAVRFEQSFSDSFEKTTAGEALAAYEQVIEQLQTEGEPIECLEREHKGSRARLVWVYYVEQVTPENLAVIANLVGSEIRVEADSILGGGYSKQR